MKCTDSKQRVYECTVRFGTDDDLTLFDASPAPAGELCAELRTKESYEIVLEFSGNRLFVKRVRGNFRPDFFGKLPALCGARAGRPDGKGIRLYEMSEPLAYTGVLTVGKHYIKKEVVRSEVPVAPAVHRDAEAWTFEGGVLVSRAQVR